MSESYASRPLPSTLIPLCTGRWPEVLDEIGIDHRTDQQGQLWVPTACCKCQAEWMQLDHFGVLNCQCGKTDNIVFLLPDLTGHDLESIILAVRNLLSEHQPQQFQRNAVQQPVDSAQHHPAPVSPTPPLQPAPGMYPPPAGQSSQQPLIPSGQYPAGGQPYPTAQHAQAGVAAGQQATHQGTPQPQGTVTTGQQPAAPHGGLDLGNYADDVQDNVTIEWLWPGYIPKGSFCLFQGLEGSAKSLTLQDLTARITTGRPMPLRVDPQEPASVLIFSAEESRARIIKNRLRVAGADMTRVLFDKTDAFQLPRDAYKLEQSIYEMQIALVLFDPLSAFISRDHNINVEQDYRQITRPLTEIGDRTGCSFVGIRHLNKSVGLSASHRGGGSVAGSAAARSGLHFGQHPEEDCGVIAVFKNNNVAANLCPAIQFQVVSSIQNPDFPVINWLGICSVTADDLVKPAKPSPKYDKAVVVLTEMLSAGFRWTEDIKARMKSEGIGWRTVLTAKKDLEIQHGQAGPEYGSRFYWYFS